MGFTGGALKDRQFGKEASVSVLAVDRSIVRLAIATASQEDNGIGDALTRCRNPEIPCSKLDERMAILVSAELAGSKIGKQFGGGGKELHPIRLANNRALLVIVQHIRHIIGDEGPPGAGAGQRKH